MLTDNSKGTPALIRYFLESREGNISRNTKDEWEFENLGHSDDIRDDI